MDFIIKKMRFVPNPDGSMTGGLEETTEKPDTLSVYMKTGGIETHLFDMPPGQEKVVEWIVQTLNYNSDDLESLTRTCCGFMESVGLQHDRREHRDIFQCPRCNRKDYGDWIDCNCITDGPEYNADDDRSKLTNPFYDNLF